MTLDLKCQFVQKMEVSLQKEGVLCMFCKSSLHEG